MTDSSKFRIPRSLAEPSFVFINDELTYKSLSGKSLTYSFPNYTSFSSYTGEAISSDTWDVKANIKKKMYMHY